MERVAQAQEKFGELIRSEFERIERMKQDNQVKDFASLENIVVGILPGDGIGPIIMEQALGVTMGPFKRTSHFLIFSNTSSGRL